MNASIDPWSMVCEHPLDARNASEGLLLSGLSDETASFPMKH